jgi:hypothetical protein
MRTNAPGTSACAHDMLNGGRSGSMRLAPAAGDPAALPCEVSTREATTASRQARQAQVRIPFAAMVRSPKDVG